MWCDTKEREFTFYPWGFTFSFVKVMAETEEEAKAIMIDYVYNGIPSNKITASG